MTADLVFLVAGAALVLAVVLTVLTGLDYVRETVIARRAQTAGTPQR